LDLSPTAEEALFAHSWPGNIRELENTIHRAALTSRDGMIEVADLALAAAPAPVGAPASPGAGLEERLRPLVRQLLHESQDDLLERVIATTVRESYALADGNQIRAAAALGVT